MQSQGGPTGHYVGLLGRGPLGHNVTVTSEAAWVGQRESSAYTDSPTMSRKAAAMLGVEKTPENERRAAHVKFSERWRAHVLPATTSQSAETAWKLRQVLPVIALPDGDVSAAMTPVEARAMTDSELQRAYSALMAKMQSDTRQMAVLTTELCSRMKSQAKK